MIIAFEGMDGVGKTETAIKVAEILKYEYIQKPMKMLFDKDHEGLNSIILESLNSIDDGTFWAMLLGSAQYYQSEKIKYKNAVLDRYLASNYYVHSNSNNQQFYDYLVSQCLKPDLTVVLYSDSNERKRRIIMRNGSDNDLTRFEDGDIPYNKIKAFLEKYDMKYIWIDSTHLSIERVVQIIIDNINVRNSKCQ